MSDSLDVSRRTFVRTGLGAVGAGALARFDRVPLADGRFSARPTAPTDSIEPGLHTLSVGGARETLLYVPPSYRPDKPAPFVLALHGATGSARGPLRMNTATAEERGFVVLAPSSDGGTWDAIRDSFSNDFTRIDKALAETFRRCRIDPRRLAVSGFSDGASYAVSLGLINGDLFTHVIGYSTGFVIPGPRRGRAKFFMSHGTGDTILPIDQCGRRIAAELRRGGYTLIFEEFDGGHTVPPEMTQKAGAWLVG